jgi:RHS repeat-associated protein
LLPQKSSPTQASRRGTPWEQSTDKVTEEFTGKELDDETGLNYFGARYYDPMIGIWNTVDPARQFTSPYLYAGNGYNVVNGVDKDGKVLIFTSNASPEFKAEFTRAIDYLNKAGVSGVIARLEALPQEILVGAGITEASLTPTGQPQITWDPYGALQTTSGGTQSPALGLFHEAYHIESYLKNPEQHMLNLIPDGSSYDNPEERRVITGPETWAAKKLGEDTRTDHYGTDKTVSHSDER